MQPSPSFSSWLVNDPGVRRSGAGICMALLAVLCATPLFAQAASQGLPLETAAALDHDIQSILEETAVPSASVALVRDGRIAYVKAYGEARLEGGVRATEATRYTIGSLTKQFTATAVLLLAQDGKLSLDDPIGKYLPGLTAGDRITVRRLLNHTAGYGDYWPEDYVTRELVSAISPTVLGERWATVPLDFQPGEAWRYCNTCYVLAGLIVEKASGESFDRFIKERIFQPLHMSSALDVDSHRGAQDARGYTRTAFGPLRPAVVVGQGWLYAAGGLAMTAEDLARWDVAMIERTLLKPESYQQQFQSARLNNGRDVHYGLGIEVTTVDDRHVYQHGGSIWGFQAYSRVYPRDRDAIVVLTNTDFGRAARDAIVERLAAVLFGRGSHVAADQAMVVASK